MPISKTWRILDVIQQLFFAYTCTYMSAHVCAFIFVCIIIMCMLGLRKISVSSMKPDL